MTKSALSHAAVLAGVLLLAAVPAFAQNNTDTGSTTGPAAGNNVTPNTAQKTQMSGTSGGVQQNTGAGAAGIAAKPNTEAGPQVKTPGNGQQQQ